MSIANMGTRPPGGWSWPLPGLYVCACGWQYQSYNRLLYCSGIFNDRVCGSRLTCVVEPRRGGE